MSDWVRKENVKFLNIYKKVRHKLDVEYLIELEVPRENNILSDQYMYN